MFSEGIFKLLLKVVSSWQVIAVTIALVMYLNIVFYASRAYHRPREKKVRVKKKKSEEIPAAPEGGASSNDELGLEEN